MRKWVASQLWAEGTAPVVVIDPNLLVRDDEIETSIGIVEIHRTGDWFDLRREWERHGRHCHGVSPRAVFVVHDPAVRSEADLPFDIEQRSVVRRLRVPGSPLTHDAVAALEDEVSDLAVERLGEGYSNPTDAVLSTAAGLAPGRDRSAAEELRIALRLTEGLQPSAVLKLARVEFSDPLALSLLNDSPVMEAVQAAWHDWILDPKGSKWSEHISSCRAELIDLFMAGRLTPVSRGEAELPLWATIGLADEPHADRVRALLEAPPEKAHSLAEWIRVAQWWGEVRSALALVNPVDIELETAAWNWWSRIDPQFLAWLRGNYGSQLTRSWANWPVSLDKVQPFLARQRATGGRLLLVVVDGMGFTQWNRIRELASIHVAKSGAVLAMLPTLTEVSRQAIAAGKLPIHFTESIRSTNKEAQHWAAAWSDSVNNAAWVRLDGIRKEELSAVPFGTSDVIGLVLSAADRLMHSAELLGDIGLHSGLEAWVRSGVLTKVLNLANEQGYETWITADHGNLAVNRAKEPHEGVFVERAGTRVRRYASKTLRNGAALQGLIWDTLPGYPEDEANRLLFAPGRSGWGPSKLSHGGLSLDEVIVPLLQIESQQ